MNYYVLETFLRVYAYSVLLKTQLQIHDNFHFLLSLVQFEGVFEVTNV